LEKMNQGGEQMAKRIFVCPRPAILVAESYSKLFFLRLSCSTASCHLKSEANLRRTTCFGVNSFCRFWKNVTTFINKAFSQHCVTVACNNYVLY